MPGYLVFKWIYVVLLGFMWFYVDFMDSRGGGLSTYGGLKGGAATPLTNLCSDAGVGRRLGCLDISYLGGFMWFCLDLNGFTWIPWIPGVEGLSTYGSLWQP